MRRVGLCLVAALWCPSWIAHAQTNPASPSATGSPAPAEQEAPTFYAPDPILSAYVNEALAANPGLQSSLASYRAAREQVTIADALPDPMLSVGQSLVPVQTRVGPQREVVTLSQMFPWFGKLELRGQVAEQSAAATGELYRTRQRDVIVQVKIAYYNLAYVDMALDITREEQAVLGHYEELAQARYASGQGLQQAVIKIQAELTKVLNRLDSLQQQRLTLAAQLNMLMSRPPDQAIPVVTPPPIPAGVSLDLEPLLATGDVQRPEIRAAEAMMARGRLAVNLARKNFWPDFTLGLSFMNMTGRTDAAGRAQPPPDNGRNAWSVAFGVNLPLRRDKYRADTRRAAEDLSAATLHRADVHNAMAFAVRDQVARLQTLAEQLRLVGDVLIPQVDEALRSTEAAYETGQAGVLDLLDTERMRLDVRLVQARDMADYLVALANLERAIGAAFPQATRIP